MLVLVAAICTEAAPGARSPVTTTIQPPKVAPTTHARTSGSPTPPLLITHGPRDRHVIALTFDADMTPFMLKELREGKVRTWYDQRIVDFLRKTKTPATIFLTGMWARLYPGVVRSLAHDSLFELENHSVDHAAWQPGCYGLATVATASTKRWEVRSAARTIRQIAGVLPRFFRFPGGCHLDPDLQIVHRAGETAVGWDVVSGDPFQPDPTIVARNVLSGAQPGSIIVMHLIGAPNAPATYDALRMIVPELKARGYTFATITELLRNTALP
jgi:peptidoglycan/xylan/chitin deacetylase (PgdA/CDA1 family)